jgi:hypothetical protein
MRISDEIPHVQLEMTEERKERFMRVARQISAIIEAELQPIEALMLLEMMMQTINDQQFGGSYKGHFLIPHSTRVSAENKCPACGTKLDAASSHDKISPEPGDISVCAECGEILEFDREMIVRRPNAMRMEMIKADGRIMATVASVKDAQAHREKIKAVIDGANTDYRFKKG